MSWLKVAIVDEGDIAFRRIRDVVPQRRDTGCRPRRDFAGFVINGKLGDNVAGLSNGRFDVSTS